MDPNPGDCLFSLMHLFDMQLWCGTNLSGLNNKPIVVIHEYLLFPKKMSGSRRGGERWSTGLQSRPFPPQRQPSPTQGRCRQCRRGGI